MHSTLTKAKACLDYRYYSKSLRKVAKIYGVSKSSVGRWLKEAGVTRRSTRSHKERLKKFDVFIKEYIASNAFTTLECLHNSIEKEFNIKRSKATVFRDLKRNKVSRKRVSIKTRSKGPYVQKVQSSSWKGLQQKNRSTTLPPPCKHHGALWEYI